MLSCLCWAPGDERKAPSLGQTCCASFPLAFVAAARLAFAVASDPNDTTRRILAPLKANICAPAPRLAFSFGDGHVTWYAGSVDLDAESLLRGGPSPEERDDRVDGESFLRDFLADGPQLSAEVLKAAESNGISRRALFRIKSELGVRATRVGGVGAAGRWTWSLTVPDSDTRVPVSHGGTDSTLSTLRPISVPHHPKSANSLALGRNMPRPSERFVTLPGGPTLPIEPILLALDLKARGFALSRQGDLILIRPSGRLTDADRAALKRWKAHVLALIDYQPEGVQ